MKKRWPLAGLLTVTALAAGAWAHNRTRERPFQEVCPAWDWCGVLAEQYTQPGESGVPLEISLADLRGVLQQVTVRRVARTDVLQTPCLCFQIAIANTNGLSITVGETGMLTCVRWDDPEEKRAFWATVDPTVYGELLALGKQPQQ